MLFNNDETIANEKILYETRPSLLFSCKGPVFAFILMVLLLSFSTSAVRYIGNMQVYLITFAKTSFAYFAILAIFVVIFILIIYIIVKLLSWYSTEYILTDSRIIIKKGLLYTRKNYMNYSSIQDINSSQSILGRLFGVATISTFSAYDNNQVQLKHISKAKEVEEILFNQMNHFRFASQPYYQAQPNYYTPDSAIYVDHGHNPYNDYAQRPDSAIYVDHGHNPYNDYAQRPDSAIYVDHGYNPKREYQDPEGVITPNHNLYDDDLDSNIDMALRNLERDININNHSDSYSNESYSNYGDYSYQKPQNNHYQRDYYSQEDYYTHQPKSNPYYQNNHYDTHEPRANLYPQRDYEYKDNYNHNEVYEDAKNYFIKMDEEEIEEPKKEEKLSSEKIIQKHFDKFK